MQSCIFDHRSTRPLDGLHYLVMCLRARPFWGLVGEADSPPILFTPTLWRVWHIFIGVFFLQVIFQKPWPFGEKIEYSDLFLRVIPLVFVVQRFPEEALKLSENFPIVLLTFSQNGIQRFRSTCRLSPHELASSVPSDILGGLGTCRSIVCSSECSSVGVLFEVS